ncbi:hypothetical protein A2774_03335 [Candidatus Roizmanbacteria bacterium RIFCSPHIGHO2_01_FULL_39_12c]|uniref:Endonuclease/exonuclease/phosphatase domain-containing protein n=1 Tax=Candidatus Roizmanbacteria bacterium RIFCSPHIGHO2_01_FULL_39_12c TaxID=1802031 RepID=A0A1F7G8W8_9BACT|nr:MAG: hypothetical protein A2774_03335 [Candidatus Roizmanbacteria bacterium RIFCSPHIGHO2_01_FULL_39_12c]OGK47863.1 MAG: hypothetical protein A2963_03350 [Candidatus Roizmanbacteria bacterium RIFCSPLOWO2_01_FULL_40_13]
MAFSLLTYNVLYNKAFLQIEKILNKFKPDIICLQEVETSGKNLGRLEKFGYKLADFSNSFITFGKIYGIATYFKPDKLKLIKSQSFYLPKSIYEMIITLKKILKGGSKPRTILRTHFLRNKKHVSIYNLHLSLQGINRTRAKQLKIILEQSLESNDRPVIIIGDFNYLPYRRRGLENLMKNYGFKEATKKIYYTVRFPERKFAKYTLFQELILKMIRRIFTKKVKIDYIFYKNLKLLNTKRINVEYSDHYPVISSFQFT